MKLRKSIQLLNHSLIKVLILFSFIITFTGCDLLQELLGDQKQNDKEITIEKSGLAVNKYLSGKIDGNDCEITLFAKSGKVVAEKASRAARQASSSSYDGYFVYNSTTKTVFMQLSASKTLYIKTVADLSGTKGTDFTKPVSVSFSSSNKTEFEDAVETVSTLPLETTEDTTDDNPNSGDDPNSGNTPNPNDNPNSEEIPTGDAPGKKVYSDYIDGIRILNFGEKDENFDAVFTSTIMPLPRPDYSAIDNAVKTLVIDSTSKDWKTMNTEDKKEEVKEDIANAAKLIVQKAGASTIKEKVRAIFTWIVWNVNYDSDNRMENTEITAFYDKLSMCDGFSSLMQQMCEAVDIDCDKYTGEVAGLFYPNKISSTNHAWNLIHLNKMENKFFLVDVTWGANIREGNEKNGTNAEWDVWFDPDPCYFATSHYSDELGSQVYPKIPRETFMNLPILDPSFELFGIDGKELLEFCYSHSISKVVTFPTERFQKYPNVIKVPVSEILRRGTTYDISVELNGKIESKAFTTSSETSTQWSSQACNSFFVTYELVDKDYTLEEKQKTLKEPEFIYYDDTISGRPDGKFTLGEWSVRNYFSESGYVFFDAPGTYNSSAVYDAVFQQWALTAPSYYSDSYSRDKSLNLKEFPSGADELKEILSQIFTEPVDSSIPLQRRGFFLDADYNEVYIPLSKKEEAVNAVLNYDWRQDQEFAEFVTWMEAHNVPEKDINFYKEMARYPSQRGDKGDIIYWGNEIGRQRFAGDDYIAHSRLVDEKGNTYWAGGMQVFFEYRKKEQRHLFRNPTIPILCVHIKDSKGTGEEVPVNFFEEEQTRIKDYFAQAGFKNTIETYYVEIQMDYEEFKKKYIPSDLSTGSNYDMQWSWKKYDLAWEEILELAAKENPQLAEIFADKNKSAMIRYFDTAELNAMWGNVNGYALVHGRFDNIMNSIGYSTNWHCNLFGSALKTMAPECFDTDCQRETCVCPLCLYSFDID